MEQLSDSECLADWFIITGDRRKLSVSLCVFFVRRFSDDVVAVISFFNTFGFCRFFFAVVLPVVAIAVILK
jgi:hypothetical protein